MQYNSERQQEWYYDERHDVFVNVYDKDDRISPQKFIRKLKQVKVNQMIYTEIEENSLITLKTKGETYEIAVPTKCQDIIDLLGEVDNPIKGKFHYVKRLWPRTKKKITYGLGFAIGTSLVISGVIEGMSIESASQTRETAVHYHELIQYQMDTYDSSLNEAIYAVMNSLVGPEELSKMSSEEQAEIYKIYEDSYYFCQDDILDEQVENIKK